MLSWNSVKGEKFSSISTQILEGSGGGGWPFIPSIGLGLKKKKFLLFLPKSWMGGGWPFIPSALCPHYDPPDLPVKVSPKFIMTTASSCRFIKPFPSWKNKYFRHRLNNSNIVNLENWTKIMNFLMLQISIDTKLVLCPVKSVISEKWKCLPQCTLMRF